MRPHSFESTALMAGAAPCSAVYMIGRNSQVARASKAPRLQLAALSSSVGASMRLSTMQA